MPAHSSEQRSAPSSHAPAADPAGLACYDACAGSCRSCAKRHGRDPAKHDVPPATKAAVLKRRAAHHPEPRRAHGVDACAFWPVNRPHPLLGVAPPGRTCPPGWPPQNERSGGHDHAYASRAGRIYPSCALLPTPRLPAAQGRFRGHSRIFSTAPRKALGACCWRSFDFRWAKNTSRMGFRQILFELREFGAGGSSHQAIKCALTSAASCCIRSIGAWPISMKACVAFDQ